MAFTLRKLSNSRCPSFENRAKFWKSQKTLSKAKASTFIWGIISFWSCKPIMQNIVNWRKTCQSSKPLLWFEVSFPYLHDFRAEKQVWVWGLAIAYTMRKCQDSRCPPFANCAKFWKSQKNSSNPKTSAFIWVAISFCARCLGWGTGESLRPVYGIHISGFKMSPVPQSCKILEIPEKLFHPTHAYLLDRFEPLVLNWFWHILVKSCWWEILPH